MKLIFDTFSRIKNAYLAKRRLLVVLRSKLNVSLCHALYKEGFIEGFSISQNSQELIIFLKYVGNQSFFKEIVRISTSKYDKNYINKKIISGEYFIISTSRKGIFISSSVLTPLDEGGIILGKISI